MIGYLSKTWLLVAAAGTVILFIVYAAVQQDYRQSANFPPMQIAEDAAQSLEQEYVPAAVVPRTVIDVSKSLSPFVMVFDEQGKVLESSMKMSSELPVPPTGVFDYVRARGEDILTWQPMPGVRLASVMVHLSGSHQGFVLSGHSLRAVEDQIQRLGLIVLTGWAMMMAGTLILAAGSYWMSRKQVTS
jgi:hypothetical protein